MPNNDMPREAPDDDRSPRTLLDNLRPPGWRNPQPAEIYNLVILGAGPAGLVAARGAAALGARVALVERGFIGGDCLHVGCVPSKTLIRASRLYADMRDAEHFGVPHPGAVNFDFAAVMAHVRRVQARISRSDSAGRLAEAGIDVFFGAGRFAGPDSIMVGGQRLRFKKALVATGARPVTPAMPGFAEAGYLTNESVFDLSQCPRRLMVIGGGPLGCEVAQAMVRLGAQVVIAQDEPMFLPGEERDAAQILSDAMARDGVEIHLNTKVTGVRLEGGRKCVDLVRDDERQTVLADEILVGIGRAPNVEDMDLERAGVIHNTQAGVLVDDFLQTSNPRIYAAGDVCLNYRFTHAAEATARLVVRNALFPGRARLSGLTIPWCTYTDPEIAHVGLYVREAREKNIPVRTFTVLMQDVDRAITDGEDHGFVKIHIAQRSDRILGATIVARHAGEMINGISLAMTSGLGLRALGRVIHTYPTQAAAVRQAADAYDRSRLTPFLYALSKRWLAWR